MELSAYDLGRAQRDLDLHIFTIRNHFKLVFSIIEYWLFFPWNVVENEGIDGRKVKEPASIAGIQCLWDNRFKADGQVLSHCWLVQDSVCFARSLACWWPISICTQEESMQLMLPMVFKGCYIEWIRSVEQPWILKCHWWRKQDLLAASVPKVCHMYR